MGKGKKPKCPNDRKSHMTTCKWWDMALLVTGRYIARQIVSYPHNPER